jgi:hypothetical protein
VSEPSRDFACLFDFTRRSERAVCSLRQPLPDVLRRTIATAGLIHKTSIASKVKFREAERRPVNGTNRQLPETLARTEPGRKQVLDVED